MRNIAQVTTAVAKGDLSQKITVEAKGEVARARRTRSTRWSTSCSSFADEVTRVAREVGTEGKLGGQAEVPGVSGTWKDLTENVNFMAANLTDQVRNIAQVTTAVAQGDLTQKITVDAKGEVAGAEGHDQHDGRPALALRRRGHHASPARSVPRASSAARRRSRAWRAPGADLTESVNCMAGNLTDQVRNIAQVTTAVAQGDLTQKITVDAKGEILELKNTINTMVDQLASFADEVTRVAREVGTEGKLGGQAEVEGVSGTWRGLTENVNCMAGEPDRSGAQHRPGDHGGRQRRPLAEDHRRGQGRGRGARGHDQHDGRAAVARSPTRSPASRARSAPRASSAARPRCRASPAPGAT